MKVNKWTLGLAAIGLVSLPAMVQGAEEKLSAVQTAVASTIISGSVDVAGQWNFGTGNANLPAYAYNSANKADGFSLNLVRLTIEKPLDEAQWAAGYRADLWFGDNASMVGTSGNGDFAIKQAYVALRAPLGNGLDFKVGAFDTVIGYEAHDAGLNPNYTRSYGYSIEPNTHVGALVSYRFNDIVSANAGVANTYGPNLYQQAWQASSYNKAESYKTYMASVALTAPQDMGWLAGSTLYGGIINGYKSATTLPNGTAAANGYDAMNLYGGLTMATPVKDLRVGASYDYAGASEQPLTADQSYWVNAVAGYVSYKLTEKLSLHGRGEYVWQSDGNHGNPGFPDKIIAATGTVQYDLWKNVLSRLEFRWDHAADGSNAYGGMTPGTPDRQNAYMVAMNIIYKF